MNSEDNKHREQAKGGNSVTNKWTSAEMNVIRQLQANL
jgi:hypothetical protein